MTLEQLRIFVAVAEREHVTRAAEALALTQSATSAAIAALEAGHAVRLFDRVGRRIVLTEAGRLFLGEAKAVLARAARAEQALADLAGLRRGSLALAASQTVGNYWLPPAIARFRARHPGIAVSLALGNTETVAAQVHEGGADLGLVEGAVDDPSLAATVVAEDEVVLVVPPGHPWAERPPGSAAELAAARWVLREPGSGTRAAWEAALARFGIAPDGLADRLDLPSNEAVLAAVEAGAGAAIVSRLVAASALRGGGLVAVAFDLPARRFLMLRHKERYASAAQRAFAAMLAADG